MRFDGLIGAPWQSHIPEWIYGWLRSSKNAHPLFSKNRELFEGVKSKPILPSVLADECEKIGELLSEFAPAILTAPIGGPDHEMFGALKISSLPILKSTERNLIRIGKSSDDSIAEIGGYSLGELRVEGFNWLDIFDLSQCIAAWAELTPLEPASPLLTFAEVSIPTHSASNVDELARAFLSELIFLDGGRIAGSNIDLFLGRFSWGKPSLTLDSIGETLGVTRERVRQIASRLLLNGAERRWPIGEEVQIQIKKLIQHGVLDSFKGFSGVWTVVSLADLFERMGADEIASGIRESVNDSFQIPQNLASEIRHTRIDLGLISMNQLEINTEHELSREYLEQAVGVVYKNSAFFGDWALVGTSRETQIQNAIAIQFAMNDFIPIADLFEGVQRVQKGRSDGSPLPDLATFEGLLVKSGLIDKITGAYLGEPYRFENVGTGYVHTVVKNASGQIMHIDQLSEILADLGINPTTTAHYAAYQPGLRRTPDGELVYAVGAALNSEQVRAARIQGELISYPTDIRFSFKNGELVFGVQVGTALLYRGGFTIPAAARSLVDSEYPVECGCGQVFEPKARISPGSQWNLSYLTNHLSVDHSLRPGRHIELRIHQGKLIAYL